jgi:hypothetical protein
MLVGKWRFGEKKEGPVGVMRLGTVTGGNYGVCTQLGEDQTDRQ